MADQWGVRSWADVLDVAAVRLSRRQMITRSVGSGVAGRVAPTVLSTDRVAAATGSCASGISAYYTDSVQFRFDFDTVDGLFNRFESSYVGRITIPACPDPGGPARPRLWPVSAGKWCR